MRRVRKAVLATFLAVSALALAATPRNADANGWRGGGGWHHGGGGWHHGGGWHSSFYLGIGPFWPVAPWWYSYPPVVVESQPVVVERQPPVYIEQPPPSPPAQEAYWYYCPGSKAYYPYVQSCSEPWVKVSPRPQQ